MAFLQARSNNNSCSVDFLPIIRERRKIRIGIYPVLYNRTFIDCGSLTQIEAEAIGRVFIDHHFSEYRYIVSYVVSEIKVRAKIETILAIDEITEVIQKRISRDAKSPLIGYR
jgi:hypothetical protein